MKIIEITDTRAYDNFVQNHPLGTIHQLWDWGVFQAKSPLRDRFWVIAAETADGSAKPGSGGEILASALVIRQRLPFGKCWLYCPRGPLGDYQSESGRDALVKVFEKIRAIGVEEGAVFFRFDPPLEDTFAPHLRDFLMGIGARPAHAHYQPENTLILDLKHEPEELLKRMKPKGRYNIKVAQKHGVKVRVSDASHDGVKITAEQGGVKTSASRDVTAFHALIRRTTARDGFSGHPLKYYRDMLETLGPARAKLYLAEYDGKVLAGMIATFFGQTATYYFGASSDEHRNTMAPYILHWQAINDARAAGFHYYDFFGVSPDSPPDQHQMSGQHQVSWQHQVSKPHPWAKVTDFKLKFGGERVNYLPAREIVYKPFWYALIRLAKTVRTIIRR